jgi:hypothetical protein
MGMFATRLAVLCALLLPGGQAPWIPDRGDGTYVNPIIHADYSDPDVVRVGNDYFMVASSFTAVPGIPVLHSRDLVNWRIVNHALPRLVPEEAFRTPQHGNGVWAPSIRHHAGKFWIYYPDPDHGIYLTTATDPRGKWSVPILVKAGKGLIDPCPLWDDDGRVYLVHAWARSRAGFNNVLTLHRLTDDGTRVAGEGRIVIDGNKLKGYSTLEGPKFYRRNGWYYIFAPAGGVKQGWQSVFRSRRIDGPYEDRIVLAQGKTDINGPHQGGLVDTAGGESWFVHFQDREAYGRIVHLQPVVWRDGWPVIGRDADGDGTGEPVRTFRKPDVRGTHPIEVPQTSDEFGDGKPGLQWQWQANPSDGSVGKGQAGMLRLTAAPFTENLWHAPNLLLQKFPAEEFTATAAVDPSQLPYDGKVGLVVFGTDYAVLWFWRNPASRAMWHVSRRADAANDASVEDPGLDRAAVIVQSHRSWFDPGLIFLRVTVRAGGRCQFSFSPGDKTFTPIGSEFTAVPGRWVGAKVGLVALAGRIAAKTGHADVDWFRVSPAQ